MKPGRPRKPGPKNTVQIKILVNQELDEAVTAAAAREGHTVSSLGRTLFELLTDKIAKRAKRAGLTPLEWLEHCVRHDETPDGDHSKRVAP